MKNIVRFVPVVNVLVIFVMWLGLVLATDGEGNVSQAFVAKANSFGVSDLLSVFAHASSSHLLSNITMMVLLGVGAELMLGSKRYLMGIIAIIGIYIAAGEIINRGNVVGASGWLYSMGGLLIVAGVYRARKNGDGGEAIVLPCVLNVVVFMMAITDIQLLGVDNGVANDMHLVGAVIGMVMAIVSIPWMVGPVRVSIQEMLEETLRAKARREMILERRTR